MGIQLIKSKSKSKRTYENINEKHKTENIIHYKLNKIIKMLESLHLLGK